MVLGQPCPQLRRREVSYGLGQLAERFEWDRVHAVFMRWLSWRVW